MNMNNIIIIDNDVNGTPITMDDGSVASGRSSCGQQQAGRHQTADPGCGVSDQAIPASVFPKRPVRKATDQNSGNSGTLSAKPRYQNKNKSFIGDPKPFVRYYTVKSTENADLTKLNLFKVDAEITKAIGEPAKISENFDRTLTIEVKSPEQGEQLLCLNKLLNENVNVERHQRYNESQGVITCSILKDYTEADIVDGLSHLGITKAYRIMKKDTDGNLQPTPTLILTFNVPEIPDKIRIRAGLYERVRQYVPLPRRCFNCQNYGHGSKHCRNKQSICPRCGEICSDAHEPVNCQKPIKCYHCKEPHLTSSRTCNKYLMEKEIIAVKTKEKISFREARQKVSQMFLKPGTTYSSILQNRTRTLEHPADIFEKQTTRPAIPQTEPIIQDQNHYSSIQSLKENYQSPPRSVRRRLSPCSPQQHLKITSELKRSRATATSPDPYRTRNEPIPRKDSFQIQRGTNEELLTHLKSTPKVDKTPPNNSSKTKQSQHEMSSAKSNNTKSSTTTRSVGSDKNKYYKDKISKK
jgi:hypothetical protein